LDSENRSSSGIGITGKGTTMEYRSGPEYSQAEAGEVRDFLMRRNLKKYLLPPDRLYMVNDGHEHFLRISNGQTTEYPVRGSFLFKLLKWYKFPSRQVHRLSIDTITSILNDYLLAIPGNQVNVTVENGEAVSITSNKYNELSDIEVLDGARTVGVACVSRNDFFMRVYSNTDYEVQPVPGDVCGIGYNLFNSETGFRSLSVRLFVRRYVCSNGAVIGRIEGEGVKVHYGHPDMELKSFLDAQVRAGEKARQEVGRLIEKSTHLPARPVIERVTDQLTPLIGRKRTDELIGDLEEESSIYDLANAITSMAQSLDLKDRLIAESLGGDLLAPAAELAEEATEEIEHQLIGA